MKYFPLLIAASLVSACGASSVDVKKRWMKDLASYSFVPMYPPREDIDIGDIRIHKATGGSAVLDSRLLWDWNRGQVVTRKPDVVTAILPGMEVVNLGAVDVSAVGLTNVLTRLFGSRIEASQSLHIALKDITTAEVSDVEVAKQFMNYVNTKLAAEPGRNANDYSREIAGFCAAAITLGDERLDEIRISMVTRLIRVGGVTYFSGRGVSTVEGKSDPNVSGKDPDSLEGQTGLALRAAAAINEEDGKLKAPVVIGVDALTLKPTTLNPQLTEICGAFKMFDKARLKEMQ